MSEPSFTPAALKETILPHTKIIEIPSTHGTLLFSQYGARLIGMFPDENHPNVLWTPENIGSLMAQQSWLIGGERLWISPERDFYYENPRDFEGHTVPPGMDPGRYHISGELSFENTFSLLNRATNQTFDHCTAKREFTVADDPYETGLAFCGVSISDMIQIPSDDVTMSCWSLAQLYICDLHNPGTAFFPVSTDATIINYFDPIPADRVEVMNGYLRFRMDAAAIYKLGIAPENMQFSNPCKAVYVSPYPDADAWFCVIKRCNTMPRSQQECIDPAKSDPDGRKGAIQSYNNGPGFAEKAMPFGEIELQMQKGTYTDGYTKSEGNHELLAYAGSKDEILSLAKYTLGCSETPVHY